MHQQDYSSESQSGNITVTSEYSLATDQATFGFNYLIISLSPLQMKNIVQGLLKTERRKDVVISTSYLKSMQHLVLLRTSVFTVMLSFGTRSV